MFEKVDKVSVVVGTHYGDEGKGITTARLAALSLWNANPVVMRRNGTAQAGHTIWTRSALQTNERMHVYSHLGSATQYLVPTYWDKHCPVSPLVFVKEVEQLKNGFLASNAFYQLAEKKLFTAHPDCPVITHYDMAHGINENQGKKESCGHGFFQTLVRTREMQGEHPLTIGQLAERPDKVGRFLNSVKEYYKNSMDLPELDLQFTSSLSYFLRVATISKQITGVNPDKKAHLIVEGAQGYLLDQSHGLKSGDCRYLTPSDAAQFTLFDELDIKYLKEEPKCFMVSRPYITRHGDGPLEDELTLDQLVKELETETHTIREHESNITNEHQGHFRYARYTNKHLKNYISEHPYSSEIDFIPVFTCLDHCKWRPKAVNKDYMLGSVNILAADRATVT